MAKKNTELKTQQLSSEENSSMKFKFNPEKISTIVATGKENLHSFVMFNT